MGRPGRAGLAELARTLRGSRILTEAGVWSVADARAPAGSPVTGPVRILVEDTLVGPDGREAAGNAELVRLAIASWTTAAAAGRS